MKTFTVAALLGVVAQLVDGALGMAYGVTSTTLLLTAGTTAAVASASVHLAEIGTCLASGVSHWRFGNVDWRVVRIIALPGGIGAFIGAVLLSNISTEAAEPWMAGVLFILGLYVMLRFIRGTRPVKPGNVRKRLLAPLGLVAGFVDATGGGGWGPIATPTLIASGKMDPRRSVGSIDTAEFVVAVCASLGFLWGLGNEGVSAATVAGLLVGGCIAAPFAAYLVRLIPARILGASVGGIVMLTNARLILGANEVGAAGRWTVYAIILLVWATALSFAISKYRADMAKEAQAKQAQTEPATA